MDIDIIRKAKEFLCWDKFPGLSIQLIETREAVSYFLPPSDVSTIILFWREKGGDLSVPLFLLFHEAGHLVQYREYEHSSKKDHFWEMINQSAGEKKVEFETDAWNKGRVLLEEFIDKYEIDWNPKQDFEEYANRSIATYK